MHSKPFRRRDLPALLLAGAALPATAQVFPSKVLSLVVPYPAGGPSDFAARQIQAQLAGPLGQPVIVENVAGAGGAIGVQRVLNAPADGHAMVFATPLELVLAPLGVAAARFKPQDLRLIAHIGTADMVLLVRKDLPFASVAQMLQAGRRPEAPELSYGSLGHGSFYHLVAERFGQLAGMKMLHVPYKGGANVLQDLMAGQIDLVFMPLAGQVRGMLQDGRVKALGITSRTRHPEFPGIPPLAQESGLQDMDFNSWSAIAVPRGVAPAVAQRLHGAIYQVLSDPQLRSNLQSGGARLAAPKSLQELDAMYAAETARFQAMAKAIGLRPQ